MGLDPVTGSLVAAGIMGGSSLLAADAQNTAQSSANASAQAQRAQSQAFIQKQIDQARADIFKLYPAAQQQQQNALNAGLSLYQQALPQMLNTFQQGNVGAQKALLAGLPQQSNAILGKPINYGALQPVQLAQPQGLQLPNSQLVGIPQTAGGG